MKFAWKVQRDVAERGWTEEQVRFLGAPARGRVSQGRMKFLEHFDGTSVDLFSEMKYL